MHEETVRFFAADVHQSWPERQTSKPTQLFRKTIQL